MAALDYEQMHSDIVQASEAVATAIKTMAPMDKMAQLESYILGHLRACQAVLNEAQNAVDQARALKRKRRSQDA